MDVPAKEPVHRLAAAPRDEKGPARARCGPAHGPVIASRGWYTAGSKAMRGNGTGDTLAAETILAFDPGTAIVGWAVLRAAGDVLSLSGCGALTTAAGLPAAIRLRQIHEGALALIREWSPDVVAVERLFFARNQTTAIQVGQASGVILLAAASSGLNVAEYTPPQVKIAVTGEGNADKRQIQYMVARLLGLPAPPRPDDVADAVAIAICHAHSRRLQALTDRPASG